MSAIILAIKGLWDTVSLLVTGLFSKVIVKVGALLAGLGLKLLSFEWIRKIWEIIQKIWDVLKKTLFNAKFLGVVKVLITLALCGIVGYNCYLIGSELFANYQNVLEFIKSDKLLEVFKAISFILVAVGLVITAILVISYLFGLLKKKIRLGFIPAILFTYLLAMFLNTHAYFPEMEELIKKFALVNLVGILTMVYAVIKAFDKDRHSSFFGFFFCGIAILACFLLFSSTKIGVFFSFTSSEVDVSLLDITFINFIKGMIGKETVIGTDAMMVTWAKNFHLANGSFVGALVYMMTIFALYASMLIPFMLLSLAVGFLMALINDRPSQHAYLTKVLGVVKSVVFCVLAVTLFAILLALVFKDPMEFFNVKVLVGNIILTLVTCLVFTICALSARALFANKPYAQIQTQKPQQGGKA